MNKLKEYRLIIIIGLLILGGLFYWFQYRPSQIKKKCASEANLMRKEKCPQGSIGYWIVSKEGSKYPDCINYDTFFDRCLKEEGL